MVDCINVKIDEGIPAREVYSNQFLQKTQLKLKMNRSKNQKIKTLNQMKTQTLRQTQTSSQLQIPPPESFKESSCKSDNWRKRQRCTN
jgi:hypothetical protein